MDVLPPYRPGPGPSPDTGHDIVSVPPTPPNSAPRNAPVKPIINRFADSLANFSPDMAHGMPPSPLNPASNGCPIPGARRLSGNGISYARKSFSYNSPNTPTRFVHRTPLAFLSNSPSTTDSQTSQLSVASSIDWQLRTPTTTANSVMDLPNPSPGELPPAKLGLAHKSKPQMSGSGLHHVKIPSSGSSSSGMSNGSPSFGIARRGIPSPLDNKFSYLQSIPPSPPILLPSADILELSHGSDIKPTKQHPIIFSLETEHSSSPQSPCSIAPPVSPMLSQRRRTLTNGRRGSALARGSHNLAIDTDDDTDIDESGYASDLPNDDYSVPSPNRPSSPL